METRKPKKPQLCEELGVVELLQAFRHGPFPTTQEVLRHVSYQLWSMKKTDGDKACLETAKSLVLLWEPARLPLKTMSHVKTKVKKLLDQYRDLRDAGRKTTSKYLAKKEDFLNQLKTRFDISHEDSLELIASDKTLTPEEREEDRSFLLAIRDNLPHSLGPLDVARVKRLERIAAKERKELQRIEKEKIRKEVYV